jgi:GNAT superfamily N-acetyltransferase
VSLTLLPVESGRQLHRFVTFPFALNRHDPHWIPPLISDVKTLLTPGKNPFFEHGQIRSFLAVRDGRAVGRVSAIRNRRHEEFHQEATGFFGFFECERDPEAAAGLLDAVREHLRGEGLSQFLGPVNPSTNEECGVLVDGFETPPMVMMTHNPPYYDELLQGCGLRKARDLLAYFMEEKERRIPERVARGAALIRKRLGNVTVRPLDKKRFLREVEAFRRVYNSAWEKNWGFVPMTDAELDHMARQLKPVVDPVLVRIAEVDGEPVAFALGLPDMNQALKHARGKLFPLGLLKILWYARKIRRVRILALGVLEEYRGTGLDVLLYHDLFAEGMAKGYTQGEFSWILEDNLPMVRPLEQFGARLYKTYRLYQGPVG